MYIVHLIQERHCGRTGKLVALCLGTSAALLATVFGTLPR